MSVYPPELLAKIAELAAQHAATNSAQPEAPAKTVVVSSPVPQVVSTVTVVPTSKVGDRHLLRPESQWGWQEFSDYVMGEIIKRHGPQPRNVAKESGIFKSFISRWGAEDAIRIARYAFEREDGFWRNAPITVGRFTRSSDPYFGQIILDRLNAL